MKKLIIVVLLVLLPYGLAEAQYQGIYGQYYSPTDTVTIEFITHDNTGLAIQDMDTIVIVRYYRGVKMDSILSHGSRGADHAQVTALGAAGSGRYEARFRAAFATDSVGEYSVFLRVAYGTNTSGKAYTYQVLRGDGLLPLFDMQIFLHAGDDFYRVLFPVGLVPKDSVRHYGIWDTNDDGDKADANDTVLVATTHFYRVIPQYLDSSKTIYHYGVPAP